MWIQLMDFKDSLMQGRAIIQVLNVFDPSLQNMSRPLQNVMKRFYLAQKVLLQAKKNPKKVVRVEKKKGHLFLRMWKLFVCI